jgi:hypothetical protein
MTMPPGRFNGTLLRLCCAVWSSSAFLAITCLKWDGGSWLAWVVLSGTACMVCCSVFDVILLVEHHRGLVQDRDECRRLNELYEKRLADYQIRKDRSHA